LYVSRGLLNLAGNTSANSPSQNASTVASPLTTADTLLANVTDQTQSLFNPLAQTPVPLATDTFDTSAVTGNLTEQQLQATVTAALDRLDQAGVQPPVLARLASAKYEVAKLPQPLLGYTFARDNTVVIDASADGYGWYVNPTSQSDSVFAADRTGAEVAGPGSLAAHHMDLLTVVLHEMGHLEGLHDISTQKYPNNLMDGTLTPGVRRIDALDTIFANA
jgi:hypothetical protein